MGRKLTKFKGIRSILSQLRKYTALIFADKRSSQVAGYSTRTTGPADAWASKHGTSTYAEKGGRAAAVTINGSAWSKSIAYGGDLYDDESNPHQVSKREYYTYTSGDAVAGAYKGGTFAYAGPGGYAEAAYRDGSSYGASVAYGGKKKRNILSKRHD